MRMILGSELYHVNEISSDGRPVNFIIISYLDVPHKQVWRLPFIHKPQLRVARRLSFIMKDLIEEIVSDDDTSTRSPLRMRVRNPTHKIQFRVIPFPRR